MKIVLLFFNLIFSIAFAGRAQDAPPTEYQIKAAFVYNFAKFVEWPPQAFADPASPMIIGVLGRNVFGDSLEQALRGKVVNNHPLQFKKFASVTDVTNCQVLFISASEKASYPTILNALRGKSILTVSESDPSDHLFIDQGGMINLIILEHKVRFQIDNAAAKKAGLTINSDLLSLASP